MVQNEVVLQQNMKESFKNIHKQEKLLKFAATLQISTTILVQQCRFKINAQITCTNKSCSFLYQNEHKLCQNQIFLSFDDFLSPIDLQLTGPSTNRARPCQLEVFQAQNVIQKKEIFDPNKAYAHFPTKMNNFYQYMLYVRQS